MIVQKKRFNKLCISVLKSYQLDPNVVYYTPTIVLRSLLITLKKPIRESIRMWVGQTPEEYNPKEEEDCWGNHHHQGNKS